MNAEAGLTTAPPRIVAIGASAAGLEPLERLFAALPNDTGCSFVVVQHLSPDCRSMMDELLARHTDMPIEPMVDGIELRADTVYLNLPRMTAILSGNTLRLQRMSGPDDQYRPIDRMLASVARERGERSLAIVLFGIATDGADGAARVHECGGQVVAQSPETARFDSMPRAVIGTGLDDARGSPAEIADLITRWAAGEPIRSLPSEPRPSPSPATVSLSRDSIASILSLLTRHYATDFNQYKPDTIERRIHRRARLERCEGLAPYQRLLDDRPDKLEELYGDLLIEVTAFFRDQGAFDRIEAQVMPVLVDKLLAGARLRIWVAGCSSGEEAYSLAMLLIERAEAFGAPIDVKILATDVRGRSLERAALGEYPPESVERLPHDRVARFFEVSDDRVRVKEEVRRLLLFDTHDVLRDAPFTQIDLLSCRNLLIYFNDEAQAQVLAKFHVALRRQGFLLLGPSESALTLEDEFELVDGRWRLYRKKRDAASPAHARPVAAKGTGVDGRPAPTTRAPGDRQGRVAERLARAFHAVPRPMLPDERTLRLRRARDLALERMVADHAPPSFLLGADGDILQSFGDTATLVPPQQGVFSRRITDLIRPAFKEVLIAALRTAGDPSFTRLERTLHLRDPGEPVDTWTLVLKPLDPSGEYDGFLLLTLCPNEATVARTPEQPQNAPATSAGGSGAPHGLSMIEDTKTFIVRWRAIDGAVVYCNAPYAGFFGSTPSEIVGRDLHELIPTAERERFFDEVASVPVGTSRYIAVPRESPDGSILYSAGHTRAIVDRDGSIVEYQSTGQDLSEEYRYRLALERLIGLGDQMDRPHEDHMQQILEIGLDYFGLDDAFVSRHQGAAHRIVALAGTVADALSAGDTLPPEATPCALLSDQDRVTTHLNFADGEHAGHPAAACGVRTYIGVPLRGIDGAPGSVCFSSSAVREEPFSVIDESFMLLVANWLTTRATIEDHTRRLSLSNENLAQFAHKASHDLQEPLRKIQQFSTFLEEDCGARLDEGGRYHLRVIVDAARRMSALISDLLGYSRTARNTPSRQTVCLDALVGEVLEDLAMQVHESEAEIAIGELPSVSADPLLLRQLFTNLLGNALKYRDGKRALRIEVRARDDRIEVVDNGIGFEQAQAGRVFEPFTRLHTAQRCPGSGIGLAIAATVCRKHGWRLSVASEPDVGSTFAIDLAPDV